MLRRAYGKSGPHVGSQPGAFRYRCSSEWMPRRTACRHIEESLTHAGGYYYERRASYYRNLGFPLNRVVSMTRLASGPRSSGW